MNSYMTRISNIIMLAEDVMEITFKLADNEVMNFTPGQFIIVEVSSQPNVSRTYSVLDYNLEANELKIAVRKVEGGQATTIIFNEFRVGREVKLMGAMGQELIVDKSNKELILVATGIGITPILCVLKDLVKSSYDGQIEFIHGARTLSELFYIDEIKELASKNKNIRYIPVLSKDVVKNIPSGYVTDVVKDMNLTNKDIYMCSSPVVAKSFKEVLINKNFDLSKFKCESA